MNTKQTLIYDISSCPHNAGLTLDKVMFFYNEHDVVFYDSYQEGGVKADKPQVVNIPEGTEIKVVDFADEGTQELFEKLTADDT